MRPNLALAIHKQEYVNDLLQLDLKCKSNTKNWFSVIERACRAELIIAQGNHHWRTKPFDNKASFKLLQAGRIMPIRPNGEAFASFNDHIAA
jgi:hypothetical protein